MAKTANNTEDAVLGIVRSLAGREAAKRVTLQSRLKHDLGFDSLGMLELCVEIEGALRVSIEKNLSSIKTVSDIITLAEGIPGDTRDAAGQGYERDIQNIGDYPLPKSKRHIRRLKFYMSLSHLLWRFEITGLENIPPDGRYILCPNHQSYFDCLWVWTAIGQKRMDLRKICCLAAEMFLSHKSVLALLGGIPVDRNGNTVPSMKRALECINSGYTMLIHPEGTRSRDGKIHEFKGGAAKLAIDAGVPIIPVRIDGAWDIFPPHRKLPKVLRLKGRYPIKIRFGKPVPPDGKTVEELTAIIQSEVEKGVHIQ